MFYVKVTGKVTGRGAVLHYYRSHDHTIGSHFVGQKKNEINRVTLISQHSNKVLRTRKISKHMLQAYIQFQLLEISLGLNIITRSQ